MEDEPYQDEKHRKTVRLCKPFNEKIDPFLGVRLA